MIGDGFGFRADETRRLVVGKANLTSPDRLINVGIITDVWEELAHKSAIDRTALSSSSVGAGVYRSP
jgi:hypothetical protein